MCGAAAGNRYENTPGFEMGDRALDRGAQLVYLGVEFLLPVKQLPALRLLKRGDEVRALIAFVAEPLRPPQ